MSHLYYKLLSFAALFAVVILTVISCILLNNNSAGTADNIDAAVSQHEKLRAVKNNKDI